MRLPVAANAYDRANEQQTRYQVEQEDARNLKRDEDLKLTQGAVMYVRDPFSGSYLPVTVAAATAAATLTNIAALRLRTWSPSAPSLVRVVSNWTTGDGGGLFRLDAADTTTADDSCFTIVDAAGNRWKRQYDQIAADVRFGQTPAIAAQACLAANQTLLLPPGTYAFGTITVTGLRVYVRKGATYTGTLTGASFYVEESTVTPTPGSVAAIGTKWEESTTTAEFLGGFWPAPAAPYVRWVFNKEFTLANTNSTPSGSLAATLGAIVKNSGTNLDAVALFALSYGAANGVSTFAFNFIGTTDGSTTGQTVRCGEMDWQPARGKSHLGFGLAINTFGDVDQGSAIYIQRFSPARWSNGIVIGGAKVGLAGDTLGPSMDSLINTNSSATYLQDAVVMAAGHSIRFSGTGATHARIKNSSDFLRICMGASSTLFRDTGDTTTLVGIDSNGFMSIGSNAALGTSSVVNIVAFDNTQGARLVRAAGPDGTITAELLAARGTAGNAAATGLRIRADSVTSRSINAGGTLNASGADYAEYETRGANCPRIAKGDIVGFDADGLLTDRYDDAVSFAIKSTNPNLVGGDDWTGALPDRPEPPIYEPGVYDGPSDPGEIVPDPVRPEQIEQAERGIAEFDRAAWEAKGVDPDTVLRNWTARLEKLRENSGAHERHIEAQQAYREAYAAWEIAEAERRAEWERTVWAAHLERVSWHTAFLEAARERVDRIAYCGKVPVNVTGAQVGQFIVPERRADGGIGARLVDAAALTFADYAASVGHVRRILPDGRAEVVVTQHGVRRG